MELHQQLATMRHALPIVFVTGHGDIPMSVRAIKAGAEDFLTKPVDKDILLQAIERALVRNRERRSLLAEESALRARMDALTPAETRVMSLVVQGRRNKQIAAQLGTTERTVKWHRHNIMQKLELKSLAEMVTLSDRVNLLKSLRDRQPPDAE